MLFCFILYADACCTAANETSSKVMFTVDSREAPLQTQAHNLFVKWAFIPPLTLVSPGWRVCALTVQLVEMFVPTPASLSLQLHTKLTLNCRKKRKKKTANSLNIFEMGTIVCCHVQALLCLPFVIALVKCFLRAHTYTLTQRTGNKTLSTATASQPFSSTLASTL